MAKIELNDLNSANSTPAGLELVNDIEVKNLTEADMSQVLGGLDLKPYAQALLTDLATATIGDIFG